MPVRLDVSAVRSAKKHVQTVQLPWKISVHILIMRSVQDAEHVRRPVREGLSGRHKIKMKSLYFQTVGIECKFYENQQLEYRLYSWGQSVFEKLFPQSARPTPRYILPEFSCRSPLRRLYCDIHLAENLFQTRSIVL